MWRIFNMDNMTMLTSIYNKAWVDARPVGKLIWAILAVVGVADAFRYFFLLSCNFVFIFFFLFGHMLRRHPLYPMQMLCLSVCLFIYMYNMPTLLLFFFFAFVQPLLGWWDYGWNDTRARISISDAGHRLMDWMNITWCGGLNYEFGRPLRYDCR